MSAGWVAGSTRGRLLLTRRIGVDGARGLAEAGSLTAAGSLLAGTRFAAVTSAATAPAAQRAVARSLLMELRLLAGWLPAGAGELVRALGAWFELVNVEDRLAYLAGAAVPAPLPLGSLASAWQTAAGAQSAADLRSSLRSSRWGDPGGETAQSIHLGMRIAWAGRVARTAPETSAWVAGALAILAARDRLLGTPEATAARWLTVRELGAGWQSARTVPELHAVLPGRAAWPLAGINEPAELWRAETRWWSRVVGDAEALVAISREGRPVIVAVVALLAADAVRVAAALAVAAGAGAGAREAFDALL